MACTDRFSFRAIDGLSRPDASNVKSCASSAGVQGRPVGRGPSFILLSLSAPTLPSGAVTSTMGIPGEDWHPRKYAAGPAPFSSPDGRHNQTDPLPGPTS